MKKTDLQQRQRALDPTQSFIVQAPAGSGKTELLTQRFLTLLSYVNNPEEILAITFTKKSASEMRDRIITALEDAINNTPTDSSHKRSTRELALKALQQDQAKNWNLIENPNRLRLQTIDSFNAWLARQLPVRSCFGASPEIADDPSSLYREAIHEFLSHLEENTAWSDAIENLLLHLDNDLSKVEDLLMRMLQKRDQWLPYITLNAEDPLLRINLEKNLAAVLTDLLTQIHQHFPKEEISELVALAKIAAQNLLHEKPDSPIIDCKDLSFLPGIQIEDKRYWLALSKLLLTEDLTWRKSFNKNTGFPPSSHPEQKIYAKELQERMKQLIEKLSNNDALHNAFIALKYAPDACYQDKQWEILASLHQTLKVIVAQLKLTFQQHGKIDYIENAHAALLALGTDEQPTDLALTLDYKIQHILIDEFQDTSNTQFRLLEKLITGWENGDGRTLFLVGDPMQSIYRFREAEVGLFIRARQKGIRQLHLEPLSLSVNFRSTPNVVEWVNEHFQIVLPVQDDIATGAISFCKSTSEKQPEEKPAVILHPLFCQGENDQADTIISLIKTHQESHPEDKIAILVRSRTHLMEIIPTLRKNNINYQAIDIDPLTTRPVIQDLMALTKALLHPALRIAWLAILRAPWCGLKLEDLLIISQNSTRETIWDRLNNSSVINALSEDAKPRIARILPILQHKISNRRRLPLRDWIESTWQLLGGPACVNELANLDDANTFFKLLGKLDEGAELSSLDNLDTAIEKLYASANHQAGSSLQIMTIHNAKGLEFDKVILPHLECKTPYDEKQLLLWMERAKLDDAPQLIIAPVHAIGDDNDTIYDYIKRQQSIKSDFEMSRLLYVAATRAKKELHLIFSLEKPQAPANSLLEKLWPAIEPKIRDQFTHEPVVAKKSVEQPDSNAIRKIKRLTSDWESILQQAINPVTLHQKISGFLPQENNPKMIGTLIHQILEMICRHGTIWWDKIKKKPYVSQQLLQLGMLPESISHSNEIILQAIQNTLDDSHGQWILHPHQEAQSEWAVTTVINQLPQSLIIDRTFIDDTGTRWIIDYKSSLPGSLPLDIFLLEEFKTYEQKMRQYGEAIRQLEQRPVRLGLYFPLVPAWYEWEM